MPDSTKRPLKVFLCHSSGDKPVVRELYRQLNAEGWIDVWLDEEKLLPGQEWDMEIEEAVEESDIVVVFLSTSSVTKEGYVQKELRFVLNIADEKPENSIFVIPLRLDDCIVPRRLRHWQWVDYFPKNQRKFAYQRLLQSLKVRARKLGLAPLSTVSETQSPVAITPVKPIASHAPFDPPEAAEKSDEKIISRLAPEPEVSVSSLPHKETKEEVKREKPVPPRELPEQKVKRSKLTPRLVAGVAGGLLLITLCIWGGGKYLSSLRSDLLTATNTFIPLFVTPRPGGMGTVEAFATQSAIAQESSTATLDILVFASQTAGARTAIASTLGIGSTMISPKDNMTLLYVPAGEFTMGDKVEDALAECQKFRSDCQLDWFKDEEPPHTVELDDFWIDQTEVTNAMYSNCVHDGECEEPLGKEPSGTTYYSDSKYASHPVVYVSWDDAVKYCSWADRRLPTEAEWEKAARGEDALVYPWGNNFDGGRANFCDQKCASDWADKPPEDRFADTAPVGSYPSGASPYGALDMAGNAWEWVSSMYKPYPYSTIDGREDLSVSGDRVLRGGSWYTVNVSRVRSAFRLSYPPARTDFFLGFRCAMSATP